MSENEYLQGILDEASKGDAPVSFQLNEVKDDAGQTVCFKCPVCQEEFQTAEHTRGQEHVREAHAQRLDEG